MRFSPPFRIRVLLSTETEEQKKRGRPGNEATEDVLVDIVWLIPMHEHQEGSQGNSFVLE